MIQNRWESSLSVGSPLYSSLLLSSGFELCSSGIMHRYVYLSFPCISCPIPHSVIARDASHPPTGNIISSFQSFLLLFLFHIRYCFTPLATSKFFFFCFGYDNSQFERGILHHVPNWFPSLFFSGRSSSLISLLSSPSSYFPSYAEVNLTSITSYVHRPKCEPQPHHIRSYCS